MRTESDRQEQPRQRHEQKQRAALIAEQQRQHAANRAAELERSRREAERQRQEAAAIAHEQALIEDDLDPIAGTLEAKLEKSAEIIDLPALPLRRKDVA
jgi:hypothetical protein